MIDEITHAKHLMLTRPGENTPLKKDRDPFWGKDHTVASKRQFALAPEMNKELIWIPPESTAPSLLPPRAEGFESEIGVLSGSTAWL